MSGLECDNKEVIETGGNTTLCSQDVLWFLLRYVHPLPTFIF